MTLKNISLRTISDKQTGRVSLFAVVNGEMWMTADRLAQIAEAPAGTVLVADSKDTEGEIKDKKSLVMLPDGKTVGFVKNGVAIARFNVDFVKDLANAMAEPEFAPKAADAERASADIGLFK